MSKPTPEQRIEAYHAALAETGVKHVRVRYQRGWFLVIGGFGATSRYRGAQIDDFTARLKNRAASARLEGEEA